MRVGHQEEQAIIRGLEFSTPPAILLKGEGVKRDLVTYHAYVMKLP